MSYIKDAIRTKSNSFHGGSVAAVGFVTALHDCIRSLAQLDAIKKALFYGKMSDSVQAGIGGFGTCEDLPSLVHSDRDIAIDLIHGIIGKATEAAELLEALDKCMGGQNLDLVNIMEEVGDGLWYDAILLNATGSTFEQSQAVNIAKLKKRFPEKFTEAEAITRDLDTERKVLEDGHNGNA